MTSQAEACSKGHVDWVVTDPIKGWRRCRTCHRIANRKGVKDVPTAPAWGIGDKGKKFAGSRGSSQEDTWSRTELLKIRGYDI